MYLNSKKCTLVKVLWKMVKKLSVNDFGIHYEEWPKRKSRTLCRVNIAFSLSKDEIVSDCVT